MKARLIIGGLMFAASTALFAQAPSAPVDGPKGGPQARTRGCAQESDPAKCEAQRKEMREHMKAAREACKESPDKRGCMTQQMCSKASDPAKCQDRAKERHARMSRHMDERQAAHEACTGKRGEELMKCLGEQHKKHHHPTEKKG